MVDSADTAAALLAVFVAALTQIGIPAVFIVAWWQERQAHQRTIQAYLVDLRDIQRQKALEALAAVAGKSAVMAASDHL